MTSTGRGKRDDPPSDSLAISVSEINIEEVEKETIEKVSRTISVLENSIAIWEAAKDKPDNLREEFERFKGFCKALSEWETKELKMKRKGVDFGNRIGLLKEFTDICQMYA